MRISDWSSDVCSSDLALSIGIVAALSSPAVGQGQRQCASHESALRQLALKYGEAVVAGGVVNGGTFLELLASPNGETWTILHINPDGRACIAGSGENWRRSEEHTSELQSLMRISYAVFGLKKKNKSERRA